MVMVMTALALVVLAVAALASWSDIRSLRIPNSYALIIMACFVPAYLSAPSHFEPLWGNLAAMLLMFIITYAMFYKGLMGGGDAKMTTALALWVGLRGLVPFIFYMALIGGLLGLVTLVIRKKKFFRAPRAGSWVAEAQAGRDAIPYGVAISVSAWITFFHTGLILH